jgi:hypothetical protein
MRLDDLLGRQRLLELRVEGDAMGTDDGVASAVEQFRASGHREYTASGRLLRPHFRLFASDRH